MLAEIEKLLKQTMGLDAVSIGSTSVERAVAQRQSACGVKTAGDYFALLNNSSSELKELIEAVVVPETWFFRDKEAFAALARLVFEEWSRTHAEGTLQVLSIPCSTGEEPYSMAMTLLDAGLSPARFQVHGVDISTRALERAREAIYRRNSFRGTDVSWRDHHFEKHGDAYHVNERVRRQVSFQEGNLISDQFLPGMGLFDFIFCRNVLIYFDRPTQDKALRTLARLLTDKGVLFVGPAETGLLLEHDFVSAKLPLAFAFRKGRPVVAEPEKKTSRPSKSTLVPARLPEAKPKRPAPAKIIAAEPVKSPAIAVNSGLNDIARLADEGKLAEAARLCETHLREQGPSAQVFYLFGLVRDAAGEDTAAVELYRKALYLDPNHYEALVHLSLVTRKLGDRAGAQVLEGRARRLKEKLKVA